MPKRPQGGQASVAPMREAAQLAWESAPGAWRTRGEGVAAGGIVPGGTQCVAGEGSPAPASAGPDPHGHLHKYCRESDQRTRPTHNKYS
eukprot:5585570-Heterocapsa_arctica.AAC.1